jgi:dinuclear metal center YbgI/SA1388 family protein
MTVAGSGYVISAFPRNQLMNCSVHRIDLSSETSTSFPISEIVNYLDDLLEISLFDDFGPNGLQVPGGDYVSTVVTGVSGQFELFERAAQLEAQLVLVHHGILWDFQPRRISRAQAARLRTLLCGEIALAAYHLPLDAHPVHGNNALIAAGLRAVELEPFAAYRGRTIGVAGTFPGEGIGIDALTEQIAALTGREPLVQGAGPERVRRIGIVSGAAADSLQEAIAAGLDAFLTGEPREHVMADAREAGIHFIAAGHYATETFGIRRLGELVAQRFGVRHEFVDIPNPV